MSLIEMPVVPAPVINNLVYYRCRDCLSTFTSEYSPTMCACEGTLERMGRVTFDRKRYEKTERVSVCDARCTNASGPLCNCKCNCANHGTGRTKEVVTRNGKVYVTDVDDSALNRAAEYRQGLLDIETLQSYWYSKWYSKDSTKHYYLSLSIARRKAIHARTHQGRMTIINNALNQYKETV